MVQTKKAKTGKKKFFPVNIPLTATKVELYGYAPQDFEGSMVKLDMTRTLKGKSLELKALVSVKGDVLEGEIVSAQLLPSAIRRMIRRGTDYIEDSFTVQCKDGIVRIKPFMITRKHVSRSIRHAIRELAKKHLEAHLKVRTTKEIFSEIMSNKIQKDISLKAKKIYPLALCEIRMLEIERSAVLKTKEDRPVQPQKASA